MFKMSDHWISYSSVSLKACYQPAGVNVQHRTGQESSITQQREQNFCGQLSSEAYCNGLANVRTVLHQIDPLFDGRQIFGFDLCIRFRTTGTMHLTPCDSTFGSMQYESQLGPIPADVGQEVWYTLEKSPVHYRNDIQRLKIRLTFKHLWAIYDQHSPNLHLIWTHRYNNVL